MLRARCQVGHAECSSRPAHAMHRARVSGDRILKLLCNFANHSSCRARARLNVGLIKNILDAVLGHRAFDA